MNSEILNKKGEQADNPISKHWYIFCIKLFKQLYMDKTQILFIMHRTVRKFYYKG